MLSSSLPNRIPLRWADTASATYVRDIPEASQIPVTPGAASLTDGFVPLNATPITAGGVPPDIRDMNGILRWLTEWVRWFNAGGQFVPFNSAFASDVGGYPAGAVVASTTPGRYWRSTADNNTNNPDVTPTGWAPFLAAGNFVDGAVSNNALAVGAANTIKGRLASAANVDISIVDELVNLLPYGDATHRGVLHPWSSANTTAGHVALTTGWGNADLSRQAIETADINPIGGYKIGPWVERFGIITGSFSEGPQAFSFGYEFTNCLNVMAWPIGSGTLNDWFVQYMSHTTTGCTLNVQQSKDGTGTCAGWIWRAVGIKV